MNVVLFVLFINHMLFLIAMVCLNTFMAFKLSEEIVCHLLIVFSIKLDS